MLVKFRELSSNSACSQGILAPIVRILNPLGPMIVNVLPAQPLNPQLATPAASVRSLVIWLTLAHKPRKQTRDGTAT